jgi:hypothetical protein
MTKNLLAKNSKRLKLMKKLNQKLKSSNHSENFQSILTLKNSKKQSKVDCRSVNKNSRTGSKSFKAISRRKSLYSSKLLPLMESSKKKRTKKNKSAIRRKKDLAKKKMSKRLITSRNISVDKPKKSPLKQNLNKKKSKKLD